jgi:hypothetical protein
VTGGVLLGAFAAMATVAIASTGIGFVALLAASPVLTGMLMGGLSMEVSAVADALTANRGMSITTRQTAAFRQIIYGQRRVGGVIIYRSTTGSSNDQFNYVIVIAGHEIYNIVNLYLDGRQVYWQGSGTGYAVRNGVGFGGVADGNDHTGPDGVRYNFGGTGHSGIYAEARYGDQTDPQSTNSPGVANWTGSNITTSVMGSVNANDPNWGPMSGTQTPWVAGCAYIYLKVEYNTVVFPTEPEIRITVNGKSNIYDPRTGTSGFTNNWALVAADVITDPVFGIGDNSVNQAQLIAAANVCDEQVHVQALNSNESRYTTNHHYDSSVGPGDVLQTMLPGAAGRISRIGGEWYLWPAYWQGPSQSFDQSNLTGPVEWKPYRSFRELFNRVTGTYTAPNFPWNVAGNLYDANGFYNGHTQNNFSFAFQSTNFPQFAADTLHGYASDQYLTADGGKTLPKDVSLSTVLSVTQAQRVAKILLMRNRQQGSGSWSMNLAAWQMRPTDVMMFTFAANGWTNKYLEVTGVSFEIGTGENPAITAHFEVIETDPSVYAWNPAANELTVYAIPATPTQQPRIPAPPTNLVLISSAGTAIIGVDGTVTPRIEVTWNTPLDVLSTQILIQYQPIGAATWTTAGYVSVDLNAFYIGQIIAGQQYSVRIASIRANGAISVWDGPLTITAGLVLNSISSAGYGIGTLSATAYTDGTANIQCNPFTSYVGQLRLVIFPAGVVTLTHDGTSGLAANTTLSQKRLYYVYYVDPNGLGGNVTPVATTNILDLIGKPGYYLIDSIVTPSVGSSSSTVYRPSSYSDIGSHTTQNPTYTYDGNMLTSAVVASNAYVTAGGLRRQSEGDCVWSGFPAKSSASALTLYMVINANVSNSTGVTGGSVVLQVTVGTTTTTVVSLTATTTSTTYTLPVLAGTSFSTISVEVIPTSGTVSVYGDTSAVSSNAVEIYIS